MEEMRACSKIKIQCRRLARYLPYLHPNLVILTKFPHRSSESISQKKTAPAYQLYILTMYDVFYLPE